MRKTDGRKNKQTDNQRINDIGCGVRRLLNDLRDYPNYTGWASSDEAKTAAENQGLVSVTWWGQRDLVRLTHTGERIANKIKNLG